jgi:opacity protein-like surface antigen
MAGRGWVLLLAAAICEGAECEPSAATDLLGLYIGGGAGNSTLRNDQIVLTSPFAVPAHYDFDERATGWKAVIGLRPISLAGAELEYMDFGHPNVTSTLQGLPLLADAQAKGPALFGLGYLPIPVPALDIYGKLGLAHLHTEVNATNVGHELCAANVACPLIAWIPGVFHLNRTETSLAYGAGIQFKLSSMAARLEYERVSESGGDQDLLSLGLTWTF